MIEVLSSRCRFLLPASSFLLPASRKEESRGWKLS
jgi:hypothetical protein